MLQLGYTITFDYYDGYNSPVSKQVEGEVSLQISVAEEKVEKDKDNPYESYADGRAVEYGNMFYGREEEIKKIMLHLVNDKKKTLIPGKTIILYGQKKCGKTSLINQVVGRIEEDKDLKNNTIVIRFESVLGGIVQQGQLGSFNQCLYYRVLSGFEKAIKHMPEVKQLLEENNLTIPDVLQNELTAAAQFYEFFTTYKKIDQGRHPVLLIMDEFTSFCAALRDKPEFHDLPSFIKSFSEIGFVQIIIGHESMIRILGQLGVLNATAAFAKTIELSALEEQDAKKLISEPMEKAYGVDVYGTPLGEEAIEKLLDLSGCSPSYLSKLCNEVFEYYEDITKKYLYVQDIQQVAEEYVSELDIFDFDALLSENGDANRAIEDSDTYKYLKAVAWESRNSPTQDCPSNVVCEELEVKEPGLSIQTRDLLHSRRVITILHGRVKIRVGLFREVIYKG